MNKISFTGHGWLEGMHPPGKVDDMKTFYQVNHHANIAHAKSVIALKELHPEAKVGASFAYSPSYAYDRKPEMQWLKRTMMIYKIIIGWMLMLMDVIHVLLFNI